MSKRKSFSLLSKKSLLRVFELYLRKFSNCSGDIGQKFFFLQIALERKVFLSTKSLPEVQMHRNTCQKFASFLSGREIIKCIEKSETEVPVAAAPETPILETQVATTSILKKATSNLKPAVAPTSFEAAVASTLDLEPAATTATTSGFLFAALARTVAKKRHRGARRQEKLKLAAAAATMMSGFFLASSDERRR